MQNLTPHPITIGEGPGAVTIPASGTVARVSVTYTDVGILMGHPIVRPTYGVVEGLPPVAGEGHGGNVYLVSALVLAQCAGREDVFAPDTGPQSAIRDEDGRILGVRRLLAAPERKKP